MRRNLSTLEKLKHYRGYALILAFIIASLGGAPDAIHMSAIAVSLYLIYEVGLFVTGRMLKG